MRSALPCECTRSLVGLHDRLTAAEAAQFPRQVALARTDRRRRRFDHLTALATELVPVIGANERERDSTALSLKGSAGEHLEGGRQDIEIAREDPDGIERRTRLLHPGP